MTGKWRLSSDLKVKWPSSLFRIPPRFSYFPCFENRKVIPRELMISSFFDGLLSSFILSSCERVGIFNSNCMAIACCMDSHKDLSEPADLPHVVMSKTDPATPGQHLGLQGFEVSDHQGVTLWQNHGVAPKRSLVWERRWWRQWILGVLRDRCGQMYQDSDGFCWTNDYSVHIYMIIYVYYINNIVNIVQWVSTMIDLELCFWAGLAFLFYTVNFGCQRKYSTIIAHITCQMWIGKSQMWALDTSD